MAIPIDPTTVVDFDQPLNTNPDFTSKHIFSTNDITGTYTGVTQGVSGDVIDFTGENGTKVTKEGVTLYPIDSEFGFTVTDFLGAEEKVLDDDYVEGWAGDLLIGGEQAGLVVSDAPTDTFKTPAILGTWLAGLGGNSVKASTEHYTVMQNVLSDQQFPDDPDAVYALDDNLILLSQNATWDGQYVADLIDNPDAFGVTDANLDGVLDIKDLLSPNESTISYDIAYGDDYSVTMKDDGKLLYRWGNEIKRPNDVRIEAELETPNEWKELDEATGLKKLYAVSAAELVVHHTITNNPNDQVRPEDFENESAIGTLPTYEIIENYGGDVGRTVWASTDPYYAGDGTLYEAGTILRDSALADAYDSSLLAAIGAGSGDLDGGYTNAWYTTMDREPFEPVLNEDGTDYVTGPRWRLLPDKYGQDLPSVVIPTDPSAPLPTLSGDQKYEVGAETQTVLNLLDWATDISPLNISAGWQDNAGLVSVNGLNLTDNFDVALYIKGDIKPATIYSAELLVDYEEITLHGDGTDVVGTAGDDYLVGVGNNTFTGGVGSDLFVLSYGTSVTDVITASTISDFEVGKDKLGLIGFDDLVDFDTDTVAGTSMISQGVSASGSDLTISINGTLVATLSGLATELGVGATVDPGEGLNYLDNFWVTNPGEGSYDTYLDGTVLTGVLDGGLGTDTVSYATATEGLFIDMTTPANNTGVAAGDSYVSIEQIDGTAFADTIIGTAGDDVIDGLGGADQMVGGLGNDTYIVDQTGDLVLELAGQGMADQVLVAGTTNYALATGIEVESLAAQDTGGKTSMQLTGNSYAQTIEGNDGDNLLADGGGAGADMLIGNEGDDMYRIYNANTQIVEAISEGDNDRAYAGINYVLEDGVSIEIMSTTSRYATYSRNIEGNTSSQNIYGNDGKNILGDGGGAAINGDMLMGCGGNDTYVVRNLGTTVIEAVGEGVFDRVSTSVNFTLTAGSEVESINTTSRYGTSSLNLTGNEFAQSIQGNGGGNRIDGRGGADVLLGEGGSDTFVFSTTLGVGNVDTLADYSVADDQIELDASIFDTLAVGSLAAGAFAFNATGVAADADDRIVFNTTTGVLSYDPDGSAAGAALDFAMLDNTLLLSSSEFFIA